MADTDNSHDSPVADLSDSGNAVWLHPNCTGLLEYLVANKAAAGDGGNFKMVTFRGAGPVLEKFRTKGGPKTANSCWNKYGQRLGLDLVRQAWCQCHPPMQGTWEAFVARNPTAAQFRNQGWPYFDLMASIMPTIAKGTHVFRPALQSGGASPPRAPSPEWDFSALERDSASKDSEDGDGNGMGEDDEDEDATPSSSSSVQTPAPAGRKRVAAQSDTTYSRSTKKARTTVAAQALSDLAASAGDLNTIMASFRDILAAPADPVAPAVTPLAIAAPAGAPAGPPAPANPLLLSPQRRTAAIRLAQQETWLLPVQRLALVKLLREVKLADEYINLESEEMRVLWVLEMLRDVGVYAFHPEISIDFMTL
ncbi:hypothetical protein B0H14DRAFT_2572520 [Mycena olivaceomarginata]|nr:hypothetical protein B0H14DRAFT_2572520 [Mycena olivaceomarginata]